MTSELLCRDLNWPFLHLFFTAKALISLGRKFRLQVINAQTTGLDLEAVHLFLHGLHPELIDLLNLCQLYSEPPLMSLHCAPRAWATGKQDLDGLGIQEPARIHSLQPWAEVQALQDTETWS